MATTNLSYYDKETIPNAAGLRFGIVVSEWNEEITEGLYKGAHEALIENGVAPEDIIRVNVPGSFELTYGANLLAETTDVDGIITLGSVIQGETKHFDLCLPRHQQRHHAIEHHTRHSCYIWCTYRQYDATSHRPFGR